MESSKLNRRAFLKAAGAAASLAGLAGCGFLPREAPYIMPKPFSGGRKLNIACIGVGGMGYGDLHGIAECGENIVAMCDVDEAHAADARTDFPNVKFFWDYRKMIDQLGDGVDAVTVSTPDHTHFPAAKYAIERGKHVFVQKPLTHSLWEARELRELAWKHKVQTLMGIQGHASEDARLIVEWVQSGAIGNVREVHLWTDRPGGWWPQGLARPTGVVPIPSTLDWNLWVGTAPMRPYNPAYLPSRWRGWWDFGCGALGDMGCHIFDASFWALNLGAPVSVEAESEGGNEECGPNWSIVTYQFPARGTQPPVKLVWYDGGKLPPRPKELEEGREMGEGPNGQLLIGDKGALMAGTYGGSPRIIPETKMKEFLKNRPPKTIPRSKGHYKDWILACKGQGERPAANFEYAGPLTETVLLGNLAIRTGKKILWDAENLRCTNCPEANRFIRNQYRQF
jgi:predicted dehydrogenase